MSGNTGAQAGTTAGGMIIGAVVGSAVPGVGTYVGAMVGGFIGSTLGSLLFPSDAEKLKSKPMELTISTSQYGIPVQVVFGSRLIAGNLIWKGNFQAVKHTEEQGGASNVGGGIETSSYTYTVSLAYGLCMGTKKVKNVYVQGKKVKAQTWTAYDGTQTTPDSHIQSILTANGKTRFPVWKNICYIVFPNFNLGNTAYIPDITVEVTDIDSTYTMYENSPTYTGLLVIEDDIFTLDWSVNPNKIVRFNAHTFVKQQEVAMIAEDSPGTTEGMALFLHDETNNKIIVFRAVGGATRILVFDKDTLVREKRYFAGDVVQGTDTLKYACKFPHTSVTATNKPITGSGWATYWELIDDGVTDTTVETWADGVEYLGGNTFTERDAVIKGSYVYWQFSATTHHLARFTLAGVLDNWININDAHAPRRIRAGTGDNVLVCNLGTIRVIPESALGASVTAGATYNPTSPFGGVDPSVTDTTLGVFNIEDIIDSGFYLYAVGRKEVGSNIGYCAKIDLAEGLTLDQLWTLTEDLAQVVAFQGFYLAIGLNSHLIYFDPINGVEVTTITFAETEGTHDNIVDQGDYLFGHLTGGTGEQGIYRLGGFGANDANPVDVSEAILTNDLYSIGLASGYLDSTVNTATKATIATNDLLISPVFDRQISVLDALQHVINHHNGFYTYKNGEIAHRQLETESPVTAFDEDSFPMEQGKMPVKVIKKGGREIINKVTVGFLKRKRDYSPGTAKSDDLVDIDNFGLKDKMINLEFCKHSRASKMANVFLRKSLVNSELYQFPLGIKDLGIAPGDVHSLTEANAELSAVPIRIMAVSEKNNYQYAVEAMEEQNDIIFDYDSYGEDEPEDEFDDAPDLGAFPGIIIDTKIFELPSLLTQRAESLVRLGYIQPTEEAYAGCQLWESQTQTGNYDYKLESTHGSLLGLVTAIGTDADGTEYVTIELESSETLTSMTDYDDLMADLWHTNLLVVFNALRNVYIRFVDATLVSGTTWKLTNLIHDTTEFPHLNKKDNIAVDDVVVLFLNLEIERMYSAPSNVAQHWYKFLTFNFDGDIQPIAGADAVSFTPGALGEKPLLPVSPTINSMGVDEEGTIRIHEAVDLVFSWYSRNRFNQDGNNWDKAERREDADFVQFNIDIWYKPITGWTFLRTISQTAQSYTYTSAQQTTDGAHTKDVRFEISKEGALNESGHMTVTIDRF